jgi:hypothetical protein
MDKPLMCRIFGHKYTQEVVIGTRLEEEVHPTGFGVHIHTGRLEQVPITQVMHASHCVRCNEPSKNFNHEVIFNSDVYEDEYEYYWTTPRLIIAFAMVGGLVLMLYILTSWLG